YDFGDAGEDAVVGYVLVVEGGQQQYAEGAVLQRVTCERHGVRKRATSRPRHQHVRRDATRDQPIEQTHPLAIGKRIRFTGGAEHGESAGALVEQPLAVREETLGIDREIGLKRGERRDKDTARISVRVHGATPPTRYSLAR